MDILKDVFRKRMEEYLDADGEFWLCEKGPRMDEDMRKQSCFLLRELEPASCEED